MAATTSFGSSTDKILDSIQSCSVSNAEIANAIKIELITKTKQHKTLIFPLDQNPDPFKAKNYSAQLQLGTFNLEILGSANGLAFQLSDAQQTIECF